MISHVCFFRGRGSRTGLLLTRTACVGMVCFVFLSVQCNRGAEHPAEDAGRSEQKRQAQERSDFDQEGVARLGYTEPGSAHELIYVLHAPPDTALSGIAIESDCPCVEAVDAPSDLLAGGSVPVRLRFKAPEKVLHYRQDLVVYAMAGDERVETWLTIDARLGLPLHAQEEVYCAPGTTTEIELTNDGQEPIKLIYALSDSPSVKAAVPKSPVEPGSSCVIEISASAGWAAASKSPALLRIKTTHHAQPELLIRVYPKEDE